MLLALMLFLVMPPVTQTHPTNRGLELTVPCELSLLAGKLKLLSLWIGAPDASKAYCRSRKVLTWWKDQTLSLWKDQTLSLWKDQTY